VTLISKKKKKSYRRHALGHLKAGLGYLHADVLGLGVLALGRHGALPLVPEVHVLQHQALARHAAPEQHGHRRRRRALDVLELDVLDRHPGHVLLASRQH